MAQNIRKNQKQVDIDGNVVGNNRPDVQFDYNGVHTNVEYDTRTRSMEKHKKQRNHSIFRLDTHVP